MAVILSAYEVSTDPKGFARCSWPAVDRAQAMRLATQLSAHFADDPRYPNAFWVSTADSRKNPPPGLFRGTRFLAKFFRGQQYAPEATL